MTQDWVEFAHRLALWTAYGLAALLVSYLLAVLQKPASGFLVGVSTSLGDLRDSGVAAIHRLAGSYLAYWYSHQHEFVEYVAVELDRIRRLVVRLGERRLGRIETRLNRLRARLRLVPESIDVEDMPSLKEEADRSHVPTLPDARGRARGSGVLGDRPESMPDGPGVPRAARIPRLRSL